MPYLTSKNCVYKKNLDGTKGKLIGCTKGSIKKYLKALYANMKEESVTEIIERIIKEELKNQNI